MGRAEEGAGSARHPRSAWRRGLLGALLPLGLLAWQVDPATITPAAPAAAAPPVVTPVEIAEPLPLLPPLPAPPEAIAPRVPHRVARVSLELPRRHRRSLLTQAFAAAATVNADPAPAPAAPAAPPTVHAEEVAYPLGLPDNPLTDLRPRYFIDGPGGGLPLVEPKLPPAPVPEPGTALLVALGLATSGAAARRARPAGSRPRGRPRPALP